MGDHVNFEPKQHQKPAPNLLENKRSLILKSAAEKESIKKQQEERLQPSQPIRPDNPRFPGGNGNFKSSFSSSSTSIKTLPDGRIEETTTIRDNNGTRTETKIHEAPSRPRHGPRGGGGGGSPAESVQI